MPCGHSSIGSSGKAFRLTEVEINNQLVVWVAGKLVCRMIVVGDVSPGVTAVDSWQARATAIDASFGHAVQLLASVTDADGALTRRDKLLLSLAIMAVKNRGMLLEHVGAALDRGIGADEIEALALALCLSRGDAGCRAVLDALDLVGASTPAARREARLNVNGRRIDAAPPLSISGDEILHEFTAVFGELPDRVTLLAEHSPAGLEAYHRMRVAVLSQGAMTPVLAELALFCVNAAEYRADFAAVHARGARRHGATETQLVEAGLCAIPAAGIAAWLAASEAIIATRVVASAPTNDSQR
jgi:alkylhydroperoxidase/carboxymuconolactone decarboxylase family protein YurZ